MVASSHAVWWYNSSARVSTPRALIYYHIPKTGGGSIVYWMLRHNPRFSLKLDYTRSHLFKELITDKWSGPSPTPRWQHTAVAVEYHYYTMREYTRSILPRIRELRTMYSSANGSLTAFTTLQYPVAHIKSWYMMWPPRINNRRTLIPFAKWIDPNAIGLMTRSLLPHMRETPNETICRTQWVPLAMTVLRAFDFVIQISQINQNRRQLCDRLGWTICPRVPHKRETGPMQIETRKEVEKIPKKKLDAAAQCDTTLIMGWADDSVSWA